MAREGKRHVTMVTNKMGKYSFHPSWKNACKCYGWEYTRRMKKEVGEFQIKKYPQDVTIDCLELLELVDRTNTVKTHSKIEGLYQFTFTGYDQEFIITAEFEKKHIKAEYHNGDRGDEVICPAFDTIEIIKVDGAYKVNSDGEEIEIILDDYTRDELLNCLNWEE